jgi:glyoxylase-like metal-dependent hydrolase (beta-lactamase superfamily II)/rhodanese-related sulfurtransferase
VSDIELIPTPALGDNSYLLVSGDEAAVVDPQRDAWPLLDACTHRGIALRYVLETHVHNDYVSGAREWQAATGAVIAGPARAAYAFPHLPMADGTEIAVGDATLRALETPGHTPEHTAYLLLESGASEPAAVFTGGSLMVGGTGRTDLLGPERTDELTRAQFRSLRRLMALGEETLVLPTHGAGSFCASTTSGPRTSTFGAERRGNPALALLEDEEAFILDRLTGLPRQPDYYRFMAPINRAGPTVLSALPDLPALSPADVQRHVDDGAWVVDGRHRWSFAAAHLPGSINVEIDDSFASFVGTVVPFGVPLVLVLPTSASAAEAVTQLLRIGYDDLIGSLDGGVAAWQAEGRPTRSYPARDIAEVDVTHPGAVVVDVRQPGEVAEGVIPGSRHIFLGDLRQRLAELPAGRRAWTVCASGRRAAVAASVLDRAGLPVGVIARGGVPSWVVRAA